MLEVITEGTDPRVLACGRHVWRLEDRTPAGVVPRDDWYLCDVCQACRAIRCDSRGDYGDRCLEARHHKVPHRFPSGGQREVGR